MSVLPMLWSGVRLCTLPDYVSLGADLMLLVGFIYMAARTDRYIQSFTPSKRWQLSLGQFMIFYIYIAMVVGCIMLSVFWPIFAWALADSVVAIAMLLLKNKTAEQQGC